MLIALYHHVTLEKPTLKDFNETLPGAMPVTVLMASRPGVTRWAGRQWEATGVAVTTTGGGEGEVVVDQGDYQQVRYGGLEVRLYQDETESYYHNLMSPQPGCYIVATIDEEDENEVPVPILVTMSFDQAQAYHEGGESVFAVPIPDELYAWVEAYVLQYYVPEKKRKRKLVNWKKEREEQ